MIILIGSGYIGKSMALELGCRNLEFIKIRHDSPDLIPAIFQKPTLVINAAAFVPKPSVDLCKDDPVSTMLGNVALPMELGIACAMTDTPFVHFSTGCLYDDQREYSETDEPTRDLKGYCGLYLASKLAGEVITSKHKKAYILRIRLPFDECDHPQNYLTKLRNYPQVWNHTNSLSHRGDCAKAALDLWQLKAPYGIYNLVNPGSISASDIVDGAGWAGKTFSCGPVTGTRLNVDKLLSTGVKIRPVQEAVEHSIKHWHV